MSRRPLLCMHEVDAVSLRLPRSMFLGPDPYSMTLQTAVVYFLSLMVSNGHTFLAPDGI